MKIPEINHLWVLADSLTLHQAASLIAGFDPNRVIYCHDDKISIEDIEGAALRNGVGLILTAFTVLKNAIGAGTLKGQLIHDVRQVSDGDIENLYDMYVIGDSIEPPNMQDLAEDDEDISSCGRYIFKKQPDWARSTVGVADLKSWLGSKGFGSGFFFSERTDCAGYLDRTHSRYPPKLAAAIQVWLAMEDENLLRGKGTVAAMEQWLESRYKELGLVHDKDNDKNKTKAGDINKSAIAEAAKVANWQPGGGAPRTPTD